ncbi:MAG: hypothetical protein AVDCRST_MAG93-1608, partial [uncultured Chloroflexia bacterium]
AIGREQRPCVRRDSSGCVKARWAYSFAALRRAAAAFTASVRFSLLFGVEVFAGDLLKGFDPLLVAGLAEFEASSHPGW